MALEDGDILINDKFNCKYGILLDSFTISFYTRAYKVMTENGIYTWDDSDSKLFRRPVQKSLFKHRINGLFEFKFFDILNMDICLFSLTKQERALQSMSTFLRDFQMEHSRESVDQQAGIPCRHDFKPWPFDIHKSYCKHCGVEK